MVSKIFKASRANFEDIKGLMLTALKEDPKGFSVSFEEYNTNSDFWWFTYIDPYLSGEKDVMYLISTDDQVVGMAGIIFEFRERKRHVATLVWVYIKKEFRGKGLGKELINFIVNDLKTQENIIKLSLLVNSTQNNALNLYKKLGFETAGVLKKDIKIGDEFIDTYSMELFL